MAIALVQKGFAQGVATYSCTLTLTAGSALAVSVMDASKNTVDDITSVGDGVNTYTPKNLLGANESGTFFGIRQYEVLNVAGGSTTITVTLGAGGGGSDASRLHILEFSGVATSSADDGCGAQRQVDPGVAGTCSPAVVTTVNGDAVIGFSSVYQNGRVYSVGSGFTVGTTENGGTIPSMDEYQVQGAAGSIKATFTLDASNAATIVNTGVMTLKASTATSWGALLSDQLNRLVRS